jgi:hypothetical protein
LNFKRLCAATDLKMALQSLQQSYHIPGSEPEICREIAVFAAQKGLGKVPIRAK